MRNFYSKKEYQEIADIFNVGKIISFTYFHDGYQAPKVKIETRKDVFVVAKHALSHKNSTVPDFKVISRTALSEEISFLSTLKGLPVPKYIKSKNNRYIEYYRNYLVCIYNFLPGHQPKKITSEMIYQLGVFLGKFHKQGIKYKKPLKGRGKFYDLSSQIIMIMYKTAQKQTHPTLKKIIKEVKQGCIKNKLPKETIPGPIHVDIKPDNELFTKGRLTGIIDFSNMYTGPLIFDVGKTIMWNCLKNNKLDVNLVKRFIKGYSTQRKLKKKELENINKAILLAIYTHLWVDLYHVPIKYVPERYALFLVKTFLPIARKLEKELSPA